MTDTMKTPPAGRQPRRMAREPRAEGAAGGAAAPDPAAAAAPQTKAARVEALLARDEGASLGDMCQATGWLAHTCRAFLTGLRKKGRAIERAKREDGITVYRLGPRAPDGAAAALLSEGNA